MFVPSALRDIAPEDRPRLGATLVRLGLLVLIGCLTLLGPHASGSLGNLAGLAAVAVALSALEWTFVRRIGAQFELPAHYLGDLGLLTAALLWGGGQKEQFAPLYLLVVAAAGSSSGLGSGLLCGTLSALVYPAALWFSRATGSYEGADWARVSVLSLVFLSVGSLAGMLAHHARAQREALLTAETRLQQMQLDTECIVRSMSSGLLMVDGSGTVVICNPAAEEILGLPPRSCVGRHFNEAMPRSLLPFSGMIDLALTRGTVHLRAEVEVLRGNQRGAPLGVSTSVLREADGTRRGVVAIFQDLTESRELARRARRMATLAAVGELSAGVAHEIRNCLNPITGCIEMLRSDQAVTGESRRLMDLITLEGERLNQFIGELLDFARMEEVHASETPVGSLLEEVARLLECHPKRKAHQSVVVKVDGPGIAFVDLEQLKRVFVNLGLNALEAMPERGTLRLLLETLGDGPASELAVAFEDTGPGIRPEHLKEIFEPFFTTKREGTGLGLSLARQVVERHGGKIVAENREGGGARLLVSLPCEMVELPLKSAA